MTTEKPATDEVQAEPDQPEVTPPTIPTPSKTSPYLILAVIILAVAVAAQWMGLQSAGKTIQAQGHRIAELEAARKAVAGVAMNALPQGASLLPEGAKLLRSSDGTIQGVRLASGEVISSDLAVLQAWNRYGKGPQ